MITGVEREQASAGLPQLARSNVPTWAPLPEIGSWQELGHKAFVKYSLAVDIVYCLYRDDVGVRLSPL